MRESIFWNFQKWRKNPRMRRRRGEKKRTESFMSWPNCCLCRRPSPPSWTRPPSSGWPAATSRWGQSSPTVGTLIEHSSLKAAPRGTMSSLLPYHNKTIQISDFGDPCTDQIYSRPKREINKQRTYSIKRFNQCNIFKVIFVKNTHSTCFIITYIYISCHVHKIIIKLWFLALF